MTYKVRTITIDKEEIYKDVNALSYKYAEIIAPESKRPGDAFNTASDTGDALDARIINRMLEYRDAKLRELLAFAIASETVESANNSIDTSNQIVYNLQIDVSINDKILKPLAVMINRYLYSGILYDWYAKSMGMQQAQVYGSELEEMENTILSRLRPSIARRPLEPRI